MLIKSLGKLIILWMMLISSTRADVIKPALIEIIAHTNGTIQIEIRTSIEALLTGINNQYKNTQDAPNAEQYDVLRNLPPEQLRMQFDTFSDEFLAQIYLHTEQKKIQLSIEQINVPEIGYNKVPRISFILLKGHISPETKTLNWYYPKQFSNNAVRVKQVNHEQKKWHWSPWKWLTQDKPSGIFSLNELFKPMNSWQKISVYLNLGIEHIVPKGLDHILFILGISLFSLAFRPLLWQVTMFTLAHTITLGLAINGVINLPPMIVEPLIALSIAYVGLENIFIKRLSPWRLGLIFSFGLLHGLGFASVLSDFGLPENGFLLALLSFSIGVEMAQVAIVVALVLLTYLWHHRPIWQKVRIIVSALIGIIGLYWTLDRVFWV